MIQYPGIRTKARTADITNTMTTIPPGLWDDQRTKDYLKLELEFANEFAAKIVQAHNDWQSYQNFWSPCPGPALIHRLPPEILSDILVRAHDGVLYWPIVLSHVDSRFRAIAKSTPLLWTRIDVNLPLPLAELYLKHSSTALLDIRMDLGSGGRRKNAASRLTAFFAVVAEHRERFASLRMSAFNPQIVDAMVKAMIGPGSNYPQLRRLDTGCLIWVSGSWPRTFLEPLDCPVLAPPQLQEMCLRGLRSRNWVTAFPEPMAGLRSLCLANDTKLFASDLLIVVTKLPNLETLVVQDCTIQQDPLAAPSAVTLPNLTTLQYVTLSDRSITSLHQVLLTPKLTSLRLWWDSGFKNWHDQTQPLVAMLRMNPQLENLDLCNCMLQSSGWRDAFDKAGSLKYLRLRSCELESNDLDGLSELGVGEDGEQRLLPLLNHLVLENVSELSSGDIRRLVSHRPGLKSLELRGWDGTNVAEEDVQFMCQSLECFVLETYCKGVGALEEEEKDEDDEDWSSSGTPSEASWVSGDEEVVSGHLATANSGGRYNDFVPHQIHAKRSDIEHEFSISFVEAGYESLAYAGVSSLRTKLRTVGILNKMTTHPLGLSIDQRVKDYLKLELELANEIATRIVQAHNDWQSDENLFSPVRRLLGVFFAAITEWKEMVSSSPPEKQPEEDYEAAIDDLKDSAYQENWTPTSIYRWPIDLEDDELRDKLVVRMFWTQHYDVEFFGSNYQSAYPLAEDLVPRSLSPVLVDQQRVCPAFVHRLPPEILSEVFVRAHDGVLYWPVVVSHVDSRLRTIAESTALLWTRIDVNLPLPLAELYLKRSSTALLDIRIDPGTEAAGKTQR
ncbi:hypothetical protein FRC00_003045 [Tulasnella sp. 408]|nr:hypothetical protein FRC00_003045 [Tulasnella sp. 408]